MLLKKVNIEYTVHTNQIMVRSYKQKLKHAQCEIFRFIAMIFHILCVLMSLSSKMNLNWSVAFFYRMICSFKYQRAQTNKNVGSIKLSQNWEYIELSHTMYIFINLISSGLVSNASISKTICITLHFIYNSSVSLIYRVWKNWPNDHR